MKSSFMRVCTGIYNRLLRTLEVAVVIFALALIAIVFSSVICRYFLNASLAWSEELSRFLFVWIMLISAVLVNERYGHMQFDYFIEHIPEKAKHIVQMISSLIVAIICVVLIIGGYIITTESMDWLSPALQIPYAAVNCIISISFSLLLIQTVKRFVYQIIVFVRAFDGMMR